MTRPEIKLPWFRFRAFDYVGDPRIRQLPHEERSYFIELLALCWMEGSCPTDPAELAAYLGITRKKAAKSWPKLEQFFTVDVVPGRRTSKRLERERAEKVGVSLAASDNANRRWEAERAEPLRNRPKKQHAPASGKGKKTNAPAYAPASKTTPQIDAPAGAPASENGAKTDADPMRSEDQKIFKTTHPQGRTVIPARPSPEAPERRAQQNGCLGADASHKEDPRSGGSPVATAKQEPAGGPERDDQAVPTPDIALRLANAPETPSSPPQAISGIPKPIKTLEQELRETDAAWERRYFRQGGAS